MSDNENTEIENTESTDESSEAPKQRGQTKKTEAELREAFKASGVTGLLEVETTAKGNTRCTVRSVDLENQKFETIYGPVAGNTFIRALEGAVAMGPLLS